jgi:hypothetical protein
MEFGINTDPRISLGYPHRPDDLPTQEQIWGNCEHDFEWTNLDTMEGGVVC